MIVAAPETGSERLREQHSNRTDQDLIRCKRRRLDRF
jgi:hypothetical protein